MFYGIQLWLYVTMTLCASISLVDYSQGLQPVQNWTEREEEQLREVTDYI